MSDLLEALKDTHRLIEAILNMDPGHNHTEMLKEASTRSQLLTDRIIEASRQAGAVGAKDACESCTSITRADELERSIREALNVLGLYSTTSITNAIRILKAALNGATP